MIYSSLLRLAQHVLYTTVYSLLYNMLCTGKDYWTRLGVVLYSRLYIIVYSTCYIECYIYHMVMLYSMCIYHAI